MKKPQVIILICIIFIILVGLPVWWFYRLGVEHGNRCSCHSRLKSIGLCLQQYNMDNNNFFPDEDGSEGLEKLRYNDYLTDYEFFICPSDTRKPGTSGPINKNNCSYIYLGGFEYSKSTDKNIPLLFDDPRIHENFINVVLLDSRVEMISAARISNCKDVIMVLNKKYKYDPAVLKKLMQKAEKLDELYGLK